MTQSAPSGKGKSKSFIILFSAISFVLLAYVAYWFIASQAIHKGVLDWMEEQRSLGFQISHEGSEIGGFPYRFELEIKKPSVTAPNDEWSWQGDDVQIVIQTYNYNHFLGFASGQHTLIDSEKTKYIANADGLQASLSKKGETVKRISIIANSMNVSSSQNEATELKKPFFHISSMPENVDDMRILLGFETMTLPEEIPEAAFLGTEIGPLKAPIAIKNGMKAIESQSPLPAIVEALNPSVISPLSEIKWGPLDVKLKTEGIKIDSNRTPAGVINVRLENIDELKQAMSEADKLDDASNAALTMAETMMKGEDAFFPITLAQGKVKVLFQDVAELEPLY